MFGARFLWSSLIFLCSGLFGCANSVSPAAPIDALVEAGMVEIRLGPRVVGFVQPNTLARTLTIVIESDGARWRSWNSPPKNPTPAKSVAVAITMTEARFGITAYLGRPCQYKFDNFESLCPVYLWTDKRFGNEAVDQMDEAVSELVRRVGAERINLIGHSGGGVIAVLLAARRGDVACIVTIAAPLQLRRWTQIMEVDHLHESLDPSDHLLMVSHIPQSHFIGSSDRVVPVGVFDVGSQPSIFPVVVLNGFTHIRPWAAQWEMIRSRSCLS
jgi:pimeloyl-ACP methyl ester carboxylesterase